MLRPLLWAFLVVLAAAKVPSEFVWGTSVSAYQVEGAWLADGKGFSTWDIYSHTPGRIYNGDTGDVANDFYNRYEADFKLMASLGLRNFRLSISWPRIIPDGVGAINLKAIQHYQAMFDSMLAYNITPYVTLFHGDMPALMLMEHQGFLDADFPKQFANYARMCFQYFGDRVKNWFTFNEPWCSACLGDFRDPAHDMYRTAHNILLAHAEAVKTTSRISCVSQEGDGPFTLRLGFIVLHALSHVYRSQFGAQRGRISIVLNSDHFMPASAHPEDIEAAERQYDFSLGWFVEPVLRGDYPARMRAALGPDRLPLFTADQRQALRCSIDYLSLNHYSSSLIARGTRTTPGTNWYEDCNTTSSHVVEYHVAIVVTRVQFPADASYFPPFFPDPSWPTTDTDWAFVVPEGMRGILEHSAARYDTLWAACPQAAKEPRLPQYTKRVNFYRDYLAQAEKIFDTQTANFKGYFAWSFLDNLERWRFANNDKSGRRHHDKIALSLSYCFLGEGGRTMTTRYFALCRCRGHWMFGVVRLCVRSASYPAASFRPSCRPCSPLHTPPQCHRGSVRITEKHASRKPEVDMPVSRLCPLPFPGAATHR
ncbi:putative Beta-glucosidase 7 [Paratrimastix pyriformis]|uniref:Beta-glucosidase 7 n=1 Tax=Paratrimastix pyriformis TaxID=342808 RepID=A0ABQ8UHK2_9EUKA|nr:putative Beta-glucosidase 7 [Paratrimastix pyriformis]